MHCRLFAADIARALDARGHNNSLTGPAWSPGHRATQASPTTVRVFHDGPDEADYLHQYAEALRPDGLTVTVERLSRKRPAIRATRHKKKT